MFKVGDKVWLKIPVNGKIKRINKRYGYTIEVDCESKSEYSYFDDTEVFDATNKMKGKKTK